MFLRGWHKHKKDQRDQVAATSIVLKVEMGCACDGCRMKLADAVRRFKGVRSVTVQADGGRALVVTATASSTVDPSTLHAMLRGMIKRKPVVLVSPLPPPPRTTRFARIPMHCVRCAELIRDTLLKMNGVDYVMTDLERDVVSVTGTMDGDKIPEYLQQKLNKKAVLVNAPQQGWVGGNAEKDKGNCVAVAADGSGQSGVKKQQNGGNCGSGKDGGSSDGGGGVYMEECHRHRIHPIEHWAGGYPSHSDRYGDYPLFGLRYGDGGLHRSHSYHGPYGQDCRWGAAAAPPPPAGGDQAYQFLSADNPGSCSIV